MLNYTRSLPVVTRCASDGYRSIALVGGKSNEKQTFRRQSYHSETVRIKLPAGFTVDELPDPVNIQTGFGLYSTTYKVENDELIFQRNLLKCDDYSC